MSRSPICSAAISPTWSRRYIRLYRDRQEYEAYAENLERTVREIARGLGLESKIVMASR